MKYLSVSEAARRAGLTDRALYDDIADGQLTATGKPARLTEDAVDRFILNRQREYLAKIGNSSDLIRFATRARNRARELGGTRGTHTQFDTDATAVFGPAAIKAARIPDQSGSCRWCWARLTASVHGGLQPGTDSELHDAYVELLGPPCGEDVKRLLASLRSFVYPDPIQAAGTPVPAVARYMGNKRCGTPVGQPCTCHPGPKPKPKSKPNGAVTAAAWTPPTDDNGAQLTARRRQALRGRLRIAQQAGDKQYAAQVRKLLTGLTASAVKPTPKTPRRAEPHGCGCTCPEHRGQR
jgi:hypothetical protein